MPSPASHLDEASGAPNPLSPKSPMVLSPKSPKVFFSEHSALESLASSIDPVHALRSHTSVGSLNLKVLDSYAIIEVLDHGAFGIVSKVQCKLTNRLFAMKSIEFDKTSDPELVGRELDIMRRLKHPYIIRLNTYFKDTDAYHLVMDLCTGGNLAQRVAKAAEAGGGSPCQLEESGRDELVPVGLRCCEVSRFLGQMLKGLAYLHNFRFAHRDIKPENYLLEDSASDVPVLKLVDFGLARSFQRSSVDRKDGAPRMTSVVGTTGYVAPEVLRSPDGYTEVCDVWSLGATAWFMAAGTRPFQGADSDEYLRAVRSRQLRVGEDWGHEYPEELQRVVLRMLQPEWKRPGCAALLKSARWLRREACLCRGSGTTSSAGCCSVQ